MYVCVYEYIYTYIHKYLYTLDLTFSALRIIVLVTLVCVPLLNLLHCFPPPSGFLVFSISFCSEFWRMDDLC